MDLDLDTSDEVSALSMDGASAIAGHLLVKRLRKNFVQMELGIPEDEEEQAAAVNMSFENERTNGCELIEPFPRTHENWQEENEQKKKMKHKSKSKKHHKHGSKSESSHSRGEGSHGRKSHSSNKRREKQSEQQQNTEHTIEEEALPTPPVMEISIDSTNFKSSESSPGRRSRYQETASDASVPSTANTSNSRSESVTASLSRQQERNSSSSYTGCGAMGMAIKRSRVQHCSSNRSLDNQSSLGDNESSTQMTGHTTHTTEPSSTVNQSQTTSENIQRLRVLLENARTEERQVLEIYKQLEKEVHTATTRQEKAKNHQRNLALKLQVLMLEHEQLQRELENVHSENDNLGSQLRKLEEREVDRDLDDVLDIMEAKIKALKFKRTKKAPTSKKIHDGRINSS
jgi:hypothetical protein